MNDFDAVVEEHQIYWRRRHIATTGWGKQNGVEREWILPKGEWTDGLFPSLRKNGSTPLLEYLCKNDIQPHGGNHNLKSSWVLGANLYFPFRKDLALLAGFLSEHMNKDIASVDKVELEYAADFPFDPTSLLGEPKGSRGANQTSPDVAFEATLKGGGKAIILTEVKFTERSFYECSGRKAKYGNPDRERCLKLSAWLDNPQSSCHLLNWSDGRRANRKYWEHIQLSDQGRKVLHQCPAAVSGYQLFRQQALAEGLAKSDRYGLVMSCLAYDARNDILATHLRRLGLDSSASNWGSLFNGKAQFATFTHQSWFAWVARHAPAGQWSEWLSWIDDRYGLAAEE